MHGIPLSCCFCSTPLPFNIAGPNPVHLPIDLESLEACKASIDPTGIPWQANVNISHKSYIEERSMSFLVLLFACSLWYLWFP